MNLRETNLPAAEMPGRFVGRGMKVGEPLGGKRIGCGLYEIHPGEQLWPYHYHLGNEERAVVVAGEPVVRTPAGERGLRPGDVVAFPRGEDGAHTFLNPAGDPARVAVFSTLESLDVVVSPDSGKVMAAGHVFRFADAVDYWDGEV